MILVGQAALAASLVLLGLAFGAGVGAWMGRPGRLEAGRRFILAASASIACAIFSLAYLFLIPDFRVSSVREGASGQFSPLYLVAALWSGQSGSLLLWCFFEALLASVAAWRCRLRIPERAQAVLIACLGLSIAWKAAVLLFSCDPFSVIPGVPPSDAPGLNPLLRHPLVLVHPPSLLLGLASSSLPWAFMMAGVSGDRFEIWRSWVRPWALFSFLTLGLGNLLGMLWSYDVLGWGGYWGWDPVENSSLFPFLVAAVLIHAVGRKRVLRSRGHAVAASIALMELSLAATAATRSGVLASVHSFGEGSSGSLILGLMTAAGAASLLAIGFFRRVESGRADEGRAIDDDVRPSPRSLRMLMTIGQWFIWAVLLLVMTLTLLPLLGRMMSGRALDAGPDVYQTLLWPTIPVWAILLIAPFFIRYLSRKGNMAGIAILGHAGATLMMVGFVSTLYTVEKEALLDQGKSLTIGSWSVKLLGLEESPGPVSEKVVATLEVRRKGMSSQRAAPSMEYYASWPGDGIPRPSIVRGFSEDLFTAFGGVEEGWAALKLVSRPFTSLVWIGGVLVLVAMSLLMIPYLAPAVSWNRATGIALAVGAAVFGVCMIDPKIGFLSLSAAAAAVGIYCFVYALVRLIMEGEIGGRVRPC